MKVKRFLCLLLSAVTLLGVLAACGEQEAPVETTEPPAEGTKLWYAYNTESYMRDIAYEEAMNSRDFTLRMQGVRGEQESAQLMITPEEYVEEYNLKVADLVNENGDKIKKSNMEIFANWYVYIDATMHNDSYYGYYPDALVPMKALKRARENVINAGENQGLWVIVTIPEDAKPGFYTGTLELEVNDEEYEIPVELTVYDAQMPEEVHPQSCFLIWYDRLAAGEGTYTPELGDKYYWFFANKRVMPFDHIPSTIANDDAFIDWIVEYAADNPKISSYSLPRRMESSTNGSILSRTGITNQLTKMAKKNIELRKAGNETIDLFAKGYYYVYDEPTGSAFDLIRTSDLILSEVKREVGEAYLKDYPDLYQSLMEVGFLVTTGYNEDLLGSDTKGGLQTWCPLFFDWQSPEQRERYWARQNTPDRVGGEEAWWYGANNPAPYPTYHIDDDLICSRVLSWMQYDYRCDGNLYWCVNAQYTRQDLWEVPENFGGSRGEGSLVYPGKKYTLDEPISTLRLESIREGLEDYEYFWTIEQAIAAHNEANGTSYDARALMAPLYQGLYENMIPTRGQPELFYARRTTVLEVVQEITKDSAAGIAMLEAL